MPVRLLRPQDDRVPLHARDLVARYQDRISGPLLDRIDMRVEVSSFTEEELMTMGDGEPTRFVAERVRKA